MSHYRWINYMLQFSYFRLRAAAQQVTHMKQVRSVIEYSTNYVSNVTVAKIRHVLNMFLSNINKILFTIFTVHQLHMQLTVACLSNLHLCTTLLKLWKFIFTTPLNWQNFKIFLNPNSDINQCELSHIDFRFY